MGKTTLIVYLIIVAVILSNINFVLAANEVTISRDLSDKIVGSEFDVVLEVAVANEALAIAIIEHVPVNATIINCSEEDYRILDDKLEILLFDPNGTLESRNVIYTVKLNSDDNSFSGDWNSVNPGLGGSIENICLACSSATGSGSSSGGGGGGSSGSSKTKKPIIKKAILLNEPTESNETKELQTNTEETNLGLRENNKELQEKRIVLFGVTIILLLAGVAILKFNWVKKNCNLFFSKFIR